MKGREVLLVVLVVAIALGSGLIGLYLGRSSVQPQVAGTTGNASISGVDVSVQDVKLYNAGQQNLLYEVEATGKVFMGPKQDGNAIITFQNDRIYRGPTDKGEILFKLEGDTLVVGTNGPAAYSLDGDKIREGQNGDVVYTLFQNRLFEGSGTSGPVVFDANVNLDVNDWPIYVVLADKRF